MKNFEEERFAFLPWSDLCKNRVVYLQWFLAGMEQKATVRAKNFLKQNYLFKKKGNFDIF